MQGDYSILYLIFFGTPFAALVALAVSLLIPERRSATLGGVIGAPLGFAIGVSVGGGFGQTEGWGWGNVGAFILGINYAGVGALMGIGCYWLAWNRAVGAGVLLLAAVFPVAHVYYVAVRPAIARSVTESQMAYWRPILTNGYFGTSEEDARGHLSSETRKELEGYVGRYETGASATPPVPPSTLKLLYDLGINQVTLYEPIPPALAQEIYIANPRNYSLARNPSTPEDILQKFADSNDQDVLLQLSCNTGLTAPVARKLDQGYEQVIAEESKKTVPDWYAINRSKEGLVSLARNPNTPEDILQRLADSDEPSFLYEMTLNKRLPDSVAEKLRQRCERAVAEESQKPKPDNSKIFMAKRGLENLAHRSLQH